MKKRIILLFSFFLIILTGPALRAQAPAGYQTPPAAIADLIDAPQTPLVSVNGAGDWMLLLERPGYPAIEELAEPELRIAGLRINPRNNGPSRSSSYTGLIFKEIATGKAYPVLGLPDVARIENVSWSPDGQHIAFTLTHRDGLELWVADVDSRSARRLTERRVNDALRGTPYEWFPDNKTILAKLTAADRGDAPYQPEVPQGPVVQETAGSKAAVRTYQDLLEDPHDEALFAYYTGSQLTLVDVETGEQQAFGPAGIITETAISPDGNYVFTGTIQRPFSYLVPYYRFPVTYELRDRSGQLVKQVADIPLAEDIPKGFGAVREGPRNFSWRDDRPATLTWVEAEDGGDPAVEAEVRDRLYVLEAPFSGSPQASIGFGLRYGGVDWHDDDLAVAYEYWWSTRQRITSRFAPTDPNSKEVLFDYSSEDRYNDPGDFLTVENEFGRDVLLAGEHGDVLYLTGAGASPEGNRPFLRAYDLNTSQTEELWRNTGAVYEYPIRLLDPEKGLMITRMESTEQPPNYYLYNHKTGRRTALTDFDNPYESLEGIEKQVVQFERKDGVPMQGNLYLPAGYDPKKDGRLPVIIWAYPREYKSAASAGQVSGSPYEFLRLSWGSPVYWVTQGYAVFDRVSMPVIGEGEEEPNDHFRQNLVLNAEGAVDQIVNMGIGDRNRIAVGGHSYGAFMTANLLAHTDLFAAGIARSGAYNRTLTPFGFQREERTYWEAPEVYYTMSPFMHADKVDEPILLIHGQADNNSGTFPIQSERFYAAIKGLGGTAKLVMLPYESHGYRARESILHMLWEQDQWLNKYVKNRKEAQP